jgi:hypothetical protein
MTDTRSSSYVLFWRGINKTYAILAVLSAIGALLVAAVGAHPWLLMWGALFIASAGFAMLAAIFHHIASPKDRRYPGLVAGIVMLAIQTTVLING